MKLQFTHKAYQAAAVDAPTINIGQICKALSPHTELKAI